MAQHAASKIKNIAQNVHENDILVVLISGGGSALLPLPLHPITLQEKLMTIKGLASSGATIHELNTVRKNLSGVKGGKLAKAAFPAKVICLALQFTLCYSTDLINPLSSNSDQQQISHCSIQV